MKERLFALGLFVSAVLLLAGCGGDTVKVTGANLEAFNNAPPEIKQKWDKALQDDKANNYAAAGKAYFELLRTPNLSPEQLQAVQNAAAALNQKMYEAADKGDAAAQKAIDELRTGVPTRPR
ncbi:MAG TPA: hypothetical protein PKX23_19920 [Verrucomicrobiota bacterium]|nr:hypothetical protein [Verrucomicrobiota bacterium]HRT55740.1 hypothetical protein [Candidatus Paceibacterota bacterium]